ncbi:MAG: hypothetical protein PV345_05435 [Wolbachia sp.]|nr:hypothetical protein [Wolbachia sp.]
MQIKEHCKSLDNNGKQELYRQVIEEVKNAIENHDIDELKKLSKIVVVIEESAIVKDFDDENPLRPANIVVESNGLTNYFLSLVAHQNYMT